MSHQCCLLYSFHCLPPDSRNAVRSRIRCARLAGTLRPLPGHQSARGCQGRGTATKPGPEAPSPDRPAGRAPRDALQAECRWRRCHWSCCNICSETERDGKKSETCVYKKVLLHWCSPTVNTAFASHTVLVLPLGKTVVVKLCLNTLNQWSPIVRDPFEDIGAM